MNKVIIKRVIKIIIVIYLAISALVTLNETSKGKEFWDGTSLKEHSKEFYVDGVHIRERVKEIGVPTLVIWAKNSNKGLDPGVALYKCIPDAQMFVFDKANHFLWLDHPKDFNSLVTWWLTKDDN